MFCERAAKKCPHSCTKMMDASTATASRLDAGPSSAKPPPNAPAPPNARPKGGSRRLTLGGRWMNLLGRVVGVDNGSDETEEEQTRGCDSFTSLTPSDPAREGEGVAASRRSTAASPRSSAGRRDAREACLPRRRGTKGRGLDAVEPETRARAIATPVDVAPLDVVARRREATASGRAAAVIDAVVAIVAIVAAVSSDEGARCFARPSAAKAKAPSTPLARDVVFPLAPTPPDRSISASVLPKMPKISLAARLREIPRF